MPKPALKLIQSDPPVEKVCGSLAFIKRTRNPALVSPTRFEPSKRVAEDDVWL